MRRDQGQVLSRYIVLVVVLFTLVMSLPIAGGDSSEDASDSGVLRGTVFNLHYESPVPHAYVLVESDQGYTEARSTNNDGEYKFNLPYGTYKLRAFVRDQEMHNATGIYVDPSPVVHDIFISFAIEEPVQLFGVIKLDGEKARETKVVFEGTENSYKNETITGKDGSYSLDVPYGTLKVTAYKDDEFAGEEEIGPFITAGPQESNFNIERTGAPPSFDEWSDFLVATWTGIAIWGACVFAIVVGYFVVSRRVRRWQQGEHERVSDDWADVLVYGGLGYAKVLLLNLSLVILGIFLDVRSEEAARYIRFWLWALVLVLGLWVTARLIMMLIDLIMARLRAQRVKEGSEVPETAYIFIHGLLRYAVIAIFGFFILLIVLSGVGLYNEIVGGFTGFIDLNSGYLVLLVLIVVLFFITNRFVKLTLTQMRGTSTRFAPQMLGILGLLAKFAIIGLFTVLFIFTLLTMAGMQEMGALIMALLTTTVGMIIAMTTTGAIGNALSGMVLMSLKPIEKGQYVEVADDQFGYVIEIGTFFTRLKTFNNEIIEIPNNLVLSQEIKNYSRRKNIGIEIDVGIGYDMPADVILDLLKKGAKGTRNIVKEPKPAAMVTKFGDYAINYKLRAFTDKVDFYFQTKSSLMQNIQEIFYSEGIEIMTPWQLVKREGTTPSREDVMRKYMENLKHKEATEVESENIAAGLDMLNGNSDNS